MGHKRSRVYDASAGEPSWPPKKPHLGYDVEDVSAQIGRRSDEVRLEKSDELIGDVVDRRRIRWVTDLTRIPNPAGECVVCFLQREFRAQDNWALLLAQGKDDDINMINAANAAEQAVNFLKPTVVITDFVPLRLPQEFTTRLATTCIAHKCPLLQVDARNIVPVWYASSKQEYAARTIRPKIISRLHDFACDFPALIPHPYAHSNRPNLPDPAYSTGIWGTPASMRRFLNVGQDSELSRQWTPGAAAGLAALSAFCSCKRLSQYALRNNPLVVGQSGLSPWIHFGHLSVQRCVLQLEAMGTTSKIGAAAAEARDAFIEEIVVRRELAENFTFYNPTYDLIEGATSWAQDTLKAHAQDTREHVYSRDQLENAQTHDELWNAAQLQLRREGKMHGFLRMYWAKKILEWTVSPQEALHCALHLNDKYSMDGTSPNGVVGCMWSIVGIHDQGWSERPVFGKIRYMNFAGCKRKFNVEAFVAKYKGAVENAREVVKSSKKRPTVQRRKSNKKTLQSPAVESGQ